MPITATCGHCGTAYQVSSKFAGKNAKCKKCGHGFVVQVAASAATLDSVDDPDLMPHAPSRAAGGIAAPSRRQPTEQERQYYRRKVTFVPIGGLVTALLVAWGMCGAKYFFGLDLLSRGTPQDQRDAPSIMFYVYVALAITVVATPIVLLIVRRNLDLLENGIETEAFVASAGVLGNSKMGYKGRMPVTFCFTVEGKEYKVRKDVLTSKARNYNVASRVPVRYDPKNPKRCVVLE